MHDLLLDVHDLKVYGLLGGELVQLVGGGGCRGETTLVLGLASASTTVLLELGVVHRGRWGVEGLRVDRDRH